MLSADHCYYLHCLNRRDGRPGCSPALGRALTGSLQIVHGIEDHRGRRQHSKALLRLAQALLVTSVGRPLGWRETVGTLAEIFMATAPPEDGSLPRSLHWLLALSFVLPQSPALKSPISHGAGALGLAATLPRTCFDARNLDCPRVMGAWEIIPLSSVSLLTRTRSHAGNQVQRGLWHVDMGSQSPSVPPSMTYLSRLRWGPTDTEPPRSSWGDPHAGY